MINNEFRLVGLATSNFVEVSSGKDGEHKTYMLVIEVEKMGSKIGSHFEIPITFYQTNKAVDVKADIVGKLVVVNGYANAYRGDNNYLHTKLIGQNLYILDRGRLTDIFGEEIENVYSPYSK